MIGQCEGAIMNDHGARRQGQLELHSESHVTLMEKGKKPAKFAGVIFFCVVSVLWLAKLFSINARNVIASLEAGGFILLPLVLLYVRSNWPRRLWLWIIYTVVLPLLWFSTYGALHELSHLAGLILIGDKIVEHHVIPRLWEGEFTVGWVRTQAPGAPSWRYVLPGYGPYIRDIFFLSIGLITLKAKRIRNAFLVGLVFVLFCLSSLFDIVDNYFNGYLVSRMLGNDFMGSAMRIGATWTNIIGVVSAGFAVYVVWHVVMLYKGFPEMPVQT
jgi:hypothetical protein